MEPFEYYCWRQTRCTRWAEAGMDKYTVVRLVGHSSPAWPSTTTSTSPSLTLQRGQNQILGAESYKSHALIHACWAARFGSDPKWTEFPEVSRKDLTINSLGWSGT